MRRWKKKGAFIYLVGSFLSSLSNTATLTIHFETLYTPASLFRWLPLSLTAESYASCHICRSVTPPKTEESSREMVETQLQMAYLIFVRRFRDVITERLAARSFPLIHMGQSTFFPAGAHTALLSIIGLFTTGKTRIFFTTF